MSQRPTVRQRSLNTTTSSNSEPSTASSSSNHSPTDNNGAVTTVTLKNLKMSNWSLGRIALTVLVFLAVQAIGVYLFSSGFLLSRLELDLRNNCTTYSSAFKINNLPLRADGSVHETKNKSASDGTGGGCWHPPRFQKVVFIVIDALRFDFTTYNQTLAQLSESDPSLTPTYINKLPILHQKLTTQPSNSLLLRLKVDAPTTTMQRIKALMTGTLPTFVDAGSNFGSSEIAEDNLLNQMVSLGKRIVFMGDDTWMNLFPSQMNAGAYPYPSFNVQDLHTVDAGCIEHLFPTLEGKENKDWDFAIAHFLGVDHAGHTFGPSSGAMAEKLKQVDGWLEQVFEKVDEGTLVVVVGDHGMDPKGDHGGDGDPETSAALFMYTPKKKLTPSGTGIGAKGEEEEMQRILKSLEGLGVDGDEGVVFVDGHRTVTQIDLVPTLALLMGIPIPFGNLGSIIPELFFVSDDSKAEKTTNKAAQNLLEATRLNAHQMHRYLFEYSFKRKLGEFSFDELSKIYNDAEVSYNNLIHSPSFSKTRPSDNDIKMMKLINLQYIKFMRQSLQVARKIWARFDIPLIVMGCTVLVLAIASIVITIAIYWKAPTPMVSKLMYVYSGVGACFGVVLATCTSLLKAVVELLLFGEDSVMSLIHETLFLGSVFGLCGYLAWAASELWNSNKNTKTKEFDLPQASSSSGTDENQQPSSAIISRPLYNWGLGLLLLGLHSAIPASDSYTIHEENAVLYFLQLFGLYSLLAAFSAKNDDSRGKMLLYSISFMVLNRIAATSTICREEKYQWCRATYYFKPNSSVAGPGSVAGLILLIPTVVSMMRSILRRSESFFSTGSFIIGICVPIGLAVSAVYWTLDTIEGHQLFGEASKNSTQDILGRLKLWWAKLLLMAAGFVSMYVWASEPSCLGMKEEVFKTHDVDAPKPVGPALPGQIPKAAPVKREVRLTIFGTGDAVGSSYFVFVCVLYMILGMLQKPTGGIMLGIGMMQIMILLDLLAVWRDEAMCDVVAGMIAPPPSSSSNSSNTNNSEYKKAKAAMAAKAALQARFPNSPILPRGSKKDSKPKTLIPSPIGHDADPGLLFLFSIVFLLLGHLHYFSTGHQTTLSSIQYNAGFIGLAAVNWVLSPLMVLFNTYGAHVLFIAAVPLLGIWNRPLVRGTEQRTMKELGFVIFVALLRWSLVGGASTLLAGWFKRHLMVWSIFAPKFIFESVGMLLMETLLGGVVMGAVYVSVIKYREVLSVLEEKKVI
ncbi:mannose-ethanolamine phosphotransferase gpi13 [Chytridiales sp. JEL 0842]|nr:mannose-ethanolamine phosphotransferase gpi13 [Chytridiales sp. JEL 0842]